MRILFWNRPTALSHPGGDTVVMLRTADELRVLGAQVNIDLEQRSDPSEYDLVHLFNFALPQWLRPAAERCVGSSTPFVVTTLCEDVERFYQQGHLHAQYMIEYVARDQDRKWLEEALSAEQPPSAVKAFDNAWVAEHAARLLTNGAGESRVLQRIYGTDIRISEVPVGFDVQEEGDATLFENKYGLRDFVLCVGRIESRKNQLSLLRALEDSALPIVLMGGGFSYQPEYEEAVRNFKRVGKTYVLGRESDEMLAAAYAAARVHVLPSWYELPGLVSLEAAYRGNQVVVTNTGTTADYLESSAWYCQPGDFESIGNAIHAAYFSAEQRNASDKARHYASWEHAARETFKVYTQLVGDTMERKTVWQPSSRESTHTMESGLFSAADETTLVRAEHAASEREFELAMQLFGEVLERDAYCARAIRGKAAVLFSLGKVAEAKGLFQEAYSIDPSDARTLCGLGMCAENSGHIEVAFAFFERALHQDPLQSVALLQFMDCCYRLERYEPLESALRVYTEAKPQDMNMLFALAGCLFRMDEREEARSLCEQVMQEAPEHKGATELLRALRGNEPETQVIEDAEVTRELSDSNSSNVQREPAPSAPSAAFDEIDQQLAEMVELKRKRRYKEAVQNLDELVLAMENWRPDQQELASLLRAELLTLVGRVEEAEGVFREKLSTEPHCARALCGIGAIIASRGQWDEAQDLFDTALRHDERSDVAHAGKALCASFTGQPEPAWQHFRKALSLNPENTRALLGVVELGQSRERYPVVEQHLRDYLEHHPGDLNFLYALAGCLFSQERYDEALAEISKMRLLDPSNERAAELERFIEEKQSLGSIDVARYAQNAQGA